MAGLNGQVSLDPEGFWDRGYVFADFNYSIGSHEARIQGEIAPRCDVNSDSKVATKQLQAKELEG